MASDLLSMLCAVCCMLWCAMCCADNRGGVAGKGKEESEGMRVERCAPPPSYPQLRATRRPALKEGGGGAEAECWQQHRQRRPRPPP
eukprot:1959319-Rhodomonas_salina.1